MNLSGLVHCKMLTCSLLLTSIASKTMPKVPSLRSLQLPVPRVSVEGIVQVISRAPICKGANIILQPRSSPGEAIDAALLHNHAEH